MRVELHEGAERDLRSAAEGYEGESIGLGRRFLLAVRGSLTSLVEHPRRGRLLRPRAEDEPEYRAQRVPRFPYKLVLAVDDERVVVLAVAHDRRRPAYWESRVNSDE